MFDQGWLYFAAVEHIPASSFATFSPVSVSSLTLSQPKQPKWGNQFSIYMWGVINFNIHRNNSYVLTMINFCLAKHSHSTYNHISVTQTVDTIRHDS